MKKSLTNRFVITATSVGALALVAAVSAWAGPATMESKNMAAEVQPTCNWTGFYLGINGGVDTYQAQMTDNEYWFGFDTTTLDDISGLVGGQLGYNYQVGAAVFGIEADGDWTGASAGIKSDPIALGQYFIRRSELDWMGTVRGRMGLAYQNVLAYVTGGVAFGGGDRFVYNNEDPTNTTRFEVAGWDGDNSRIGWTAGVGVEMMAGCHWTVKAETLFTDFGDDKESASIDIPAGNARGFHWTFDDKVWQFRVGLNYKFGGGR